MQIGYFAPFQKGVADTNCHENGATVAPAWQMGLHGQNSVSNQTVRLEANGFLAHKRQQSKSDVQKLQTHTCETLQRSASSAFFSDNILLGGWSFATAVSGRYILLHAGAQHCRYMLAVVCLEGVECTALCMLDTA